MTLAIAFDDPAALDAAEVVRKGVNLSRMAQASLPALPASAYREFRA